MYRRTHHLTQSDKLVSSVLPCYQHVKSVTNNHFISRDMLIYILSEQNVAAVKACFYVKRLLTDLVLMLFQQTVVMHMCMNTCVHQMMVVKIN